MTTIASQTAVNTQLLASKTASTADTANQSVATSTGAADAQTPLAASAANTLAAAVAASANSGSYSFSMVAQNALTVLNAGIQTLGKTPDIYTTGAQWDKIFGNMDRRSLYAVASNEGGQFTTMEQQVAGSMMSYQLSQSTGNASTGSNSGDAAAFQKAVTFLQNVSPEEKQSVGWAMNMASAQTSYNIEAQSAGQSPLASSSTYTNPLVKALMAAMKSAQSSPTTDRSVGPQNTLAEILNQPWAQGFQSQIQQAYAASAPQGSVVNVSA